MRLNTDGTRALLALTLTLPTVGGCGRVTDGDYNGTPLFSVKGTVSGATSQALESPYVGLLWEKFANFSHPSDYAPDPGVHHKIIGETAPVQAAFPARFDLDLFEAPPEGFFDTCSPPTGKQTSYAVARVFAYADLDGDRRFDVKPGPDYYTVAEPDILLGDVGQGNDHYLVYISPTPVADNDNGCVMPMLLGWAMDNDLVKPGYQFISGRCRVGEADAGPNCDGKVTGAEEEIALELFAKPTSQLPTCLDGACYSDQDAEWETCSQEATRVVGPANSVPAVVQCWRDRCPDLSRECLDAAHGPCLSENPLFWRQTLQDCYKRLRAGK